MLDLVSSLVIDNYVDGSLYDLEQEEEKKRIDFLDTGKNNLALFDLGIVLEFLVDVTQLQTHLVDHISAIVVLFARLVFGVSLHINLLKYVVQRVRPMQPHHVLVDPQNPLLVCFLFSEGEERLR